MEQKRPADIIQELLDYLWNGLGLEEKGWKRLKKGDFKKKMKNGLTYQIWFDRSRYNYIDYEIGHGNVEVGFTGIDDDIHVGAAPVKPDLIGQPVFHFLFEVALFQTLPALFLQAQAVPQVVQKFLNYICRPFLFHGLHPLTNSL